MPFSISGNLEKIEYNALVQFQKYFGIILSERQFEKQRYSLIYNSLRTRHDYVKVMGDLTKEELVSFIFLLSQFGDIIIGEVPEDLIRFENNPYVLEWRKGMYMIPREVLDFFSMEKVFRNQNYLFALIPLLSVKEKKAWIRWLASDYEGESERDLNYAIYEKIRILQKPMQGKTLIQEKEITLQKLWKLGENKIVDWYYKGLTTFYYTMQELSLVESDPFVLHVLQMIKSGRLILKKEPEKFRERENYKLVMTVEGSSIQFRETSFSWEVEKKRPTDYLFG
jgi:hypothetical protein